MALVWNISAKQALTCSALSGMDYHEHHVASAAGVALPVDEVGCASALARLFFADFELTLGADAATDAVPGAMVSVLEEPIAARAEMRQALGFG
jgi:hypothetical protein